MQSSGVPQTFLNSPAIAANTGAGAILSGYISGSYPINYQWYQNGQSVAGGTNRWLQLTDLSPTNAGLYTVAASNLAGAAMSAPISLTVSNTPYFTPAFPVQQNAVVGEPLRVSVNPSGASPLDFQSQLNGNLLTGNSQISGLGTPTLCFEAVTYADDGIFNLTVTNEYGSFSGLMADLTVTPVLGWGDNSSGQLLISPSATNVVAVAAGGDHSLALRTDGGVVAWGDNTYGQNTVPPSVSNVVAIAEGDTSSLAMRSDGTIVAWGDNTYGLTNVPASVFGAAQIAAGATVAEALMPNGLVIAWDNATPSQKAGYSPTGTTNIVSLAARGANYLALCANGSVVSWGNTAPPALTNAIAVAAGAFHGLALQANGSVAAWGQNTYGQTQVPASATNIIAIAAGDYNSLALRADGTLFAWGDYTNYNQIPAPAYPNIVTLAAGSLHNLAVLSQPLVSMVNAGGSLLLSSGNLGGGLSTFQWFFDGQPITGATNSSLLLTNLQWATSGYYQVVVSNPVQVVSGPLINVSVPPFQFNLSALTWQPANGSVTLQLTGASPTNSVEIFASTNLLQWQPIFTNPPTSNPITFTDTPPPNVLQRFYRAMQIP